MDEITKDKLATNQARRDSLEIKTRDSLENSRVRREALMANSARQQERHEAKMARSKELAENEANNKKVNKASAIVKGFGGVPVGGRTSGGSGGFGSEYGFMNGEQFKIVITSPETAVSPTVIRNALGSPSWKLNTIGSFSGYLKVAALTDDCGGTKYDDEIETLLLKGVFL